MLQNIESIRLLVDLAIILSAALFLGYILSKLKQPVILGHIVAGIIIGPYVLGLIGRPEEVHVLAQIGVALLLFVVGLEFSPKTLKKIWKISVFGGILEMLIMFTLGFGIGIMFELGFVQSVFIGAIISVSSTIIIIRVLQDLGEERSLGWRIMIGILMVEDAGVIVLVTLLSNLFMGGESSLSAYALPILLSLTFVATMLLLGRTVLPKIVKRVSHLQSENLFIVTGLVISLGTASIAHLLGIPLALGAFLAGFVLAESEYGMEIVNNIRPLRNIFMIIFFVSIGMSVNIFLVGGNLFFVGVILMMMIGGKFLVLLISTKIFGYTTKTAFKVGLGMIQIGEFSFVMAELGLSMGLISPAIYSSTITVALITIVITPYSIMNSDKVYGWFKGFDTLSEGWNKVSPSVKEEKTLESEKTLEDHVVLIGYGTVGHLTVDTLVPRRKPFVVLDHDPKKMEILEELNFPYIYGDATNADILKKANVEKAEMVVVTIPGEKEVRTIVHSVKQMNSNCEMMARVHSKRLKEDIEDRVDHIIYPESLGSKAVVSIVEDHLEDAER